MRIRIQVAPKAAPDNWWTLGEVIRSWTPPYWIDVSPGGEAPIACWRRRSRLLHPALVRGPLHPSLGCEVHD